jgi:hypothetical protein
MEASPGQSTTGSVVLDLGDNVGVAIVVTPASLAGSEIEIRRFGTSWNGTHVAVRPRQVADGTVHAALFYGLPEGGYQARVRGRFDGLIAELEVAGGHVTMTELHGY